jgi:hypothetical protein
MRSNVRSCGRWLGAQFTSSRPFALADLLRVSRHGAYTDYRNDDKRQNGHAGGHRRGRQRAPDELSIDTERFFAGVPGQRTRDGLFRARRRGACWQTFGTGGGADGQSVASPLVRRSSPETLRSARRPCRAYCWAVRAATRSSRSPVASPDGPASALGLHRIPPSGRFFGLDFTHFLAGDSAVIAPIIRLLFRRSI